MFRKLLSNLPFNPSLITQVSFYAKRLNREASVRRLGLVFVSLTLAVQAFAVISPAEASNQCSSNDVVRCGFRTRSEAVQRCNANTAGFRLILEHYGVSCAALAGAGTETVNSRASNNRLYSMGRNPYQKPGEYAYDIQGAGRFYYRPLSSWGNVNYRMLTTRTRDGAPLRIMYDCGNIVIDRDYRPPSRPEPPSKISLKKVNNPTKAVKPGDIITYTIAFANKGGTSAFFTVNDRLSPELEFIDSKHGGWIFKRKGQTMSWNNNTPPFYTFGNTDAFGTPGFVTIRAKVKQNVASGRSVCNTAWATDVSPTTRKVKNWGESTVCNKVVVECPPGTIPQPNGSCKTPDPEVKESLLAVDKKAKNVTQNIDDANNTTANPGDVIEYSLTTQNYGEGEAKDVILKPEELADILEYANLDLNSLDGGVFDNDTQTLAWDNPVTIKPQEGITKTFRVTVKDPLPQTPSPTGNPGSYDLVMTNVYGNTINIKLPGGIVKNTEQVTQTLPNTGPGGALAIGGTLTVIVGYFFARSRLMAKELALVKQEYASGN